MDDKEDAKVARRGWAALLAVLSAKGVITEDEHRDIAAEAHGFATAAMPTRLRLVTKVIDEDETELPDPAA